MSYRDLGAARIAIGLWGPNSRAVLQSVTADDCSNEALVPHAIVDADHHAPGT